MNSITPTPAVPAGEPVRLRLSELKTRSEQALPILREHFKDNLYGDVFFAEDGENYHGLNIACDCPDVRAEYSCLRCSHPLAGTPMIGAVSGYFEPEWDEETTYGLLQEVLWWNAKPDSMTEAQWVDALAVVRLTPEAHAAHWADFDRECADLDRSALPTDPQAVPTEGVA